MVPFNDVRNGTSSLEVYLITKFDSFTYVVSQELVFSSKFLKPQLKKSESSKKGVVHRTDKKGERWFERFTSL